MPHYKAQGTIHPNQRANRDDYTYEVQVPGVGTFVLNTTDYHKIGETLLVEGESDDQFTKAVPPKHLLQELLELTEHAPYAYSGRGMFGHQCLATNGHKPLEIVAHVLSTLAENIPLSSDAASEQLEVLSTTLLRTQSDSMGLGVVLYWPGIPFISGEAEDG